jgi:hypothetical protein
VRLFCSRHRTISPYKGKYIILSDIARNIFLLNFNVSELTAIGIQIQAFQAYRELLESIHHTQKAWRYGHQLLIHAGDIATNGQWS